MRNRIFITVIFALFAIGNAMAIIGGVSPRQTSAPSYKTESGDCRIPVSQTDLDINNVRCRLLAAGDLWWDFDKGEI